MNAAQRCRNALAWAWSCIQAPRPVDTAEIRRRLESGQIKKILIIRAQQGIGDLILATPVFRALKEKYPAIAIHFLGSPRNLPAVQTNTRIAKLWVWDKAAMWSPTHCIRFFRALRAERFDLALIMFSSAPSLNGFVIARLSEATCVGSCGIDASHVGTPWSRWMSDWQAPSAPIGAPEYQKFFALAAPLVDAPCPAPEFHVDDAVDAWARNIWDRMGLTHNPVPIALFLGGNLNRAGRLWRPEDWAQLAKLIRDRKEYAVVAICPPRKFSSLGIREADFYGEFKRMLGVDIPVFDEPGLPQAAAFLKRMSLFICPDGGLFHVAAAAGVRTLGLFFDTDPSDWRPPVDTVNCLRAPEGKPEQLLPEAVYQALLATLEKLSLA